MPNLCASKEIKTEKNFLKTFTDLTHIPKNKAIENSQYFSAYSKSISLDTNDQIDLTVNERRKRNYSKACFEDINDHKIEFPVKCENMFVNRNMNSMFTEKENNRQQQIIQTENCCLYSNDEKLLLSTSMKSCLNPVGYNGTDLQLRNPLDTSSFLQCHAKDNVNISLPSLKQKMKTTSNCYLHNVSILYFCL